MARAIDRLSARRAETLKEPGRHADGGGLYLSIAPTGARRWVFLFRWKGKPTEMGLGSAQDVPLAKARRIAADARGQLAEGVNPLEAKRALEAARKPARPVTFGECAGEVIESLGATWRNETHRSQWRQTVAVYCRAIRDKPVAEVGNEDVLRVLRPLWGTVPATATRVRARIERILDFAKARGMRSGENPARWRGHLDSVLPKREPRTRQHHKALPFEDVSDFAAELRARGGVRPRALEFLVLTGARTAEVLGAEWSEIDLAERLWTVPAARMKKGREHRVPLSDRAVTVLSEMASIRSSEFVFPGMKRGRPLSPRSLDSLMRTKMGVPVTVHGFRSTFRDWAGECTSFPSEIAEAALAHVVGNETERAYRRGDALEKRRSLMAAWSNFLDPRENVVPLVAAR